MNYTVYHAYCSIIAVMFGVWYTNYDLNFVILYDRHWPGQNGLDGLISFFRSEGALRVVGSIATVMVLKFICTSTTPVAEKVQLHESNLTQI